MLLQARVRHATCKRSEPSSTGLHISIEVAVFSDYLEHDRLLGHPLRRLPSPPLILSMDPLRYTEAGKNHVYRLTRPSSFREPAPQGIPEVAETAAVPESGALALPGGYEASAPSSSTCTRFVDARVWEHLREELTDMVLSFIPIHRFWETVMAIDSPKWKAIFSDPVRMSPQMLGHMRNVNSSYGYLLWKGRFVSYHSSTQAAPLVTAFEHEASVWQSLPPFPAQRPEHARVRVVTGSGGLLCVVNPPGPNNHTPTRYGIWNPFLHSVRWLPASPVPDERNSWIDKYRMSYIQLHLVVDALHRSYKVLEVYWHPISRCWCSYSVYNARSGCWTERKPIRYPKCISEGILCGSSVSCGEYVCFANLIWSFYGVAVYNAEEDSWSQFITTENYYFLERDDSSPHVRRLINKLHSLVALEGKVYIILSISVEEFGREICVHIASMDPKTIYRGTGVPGIRSPPVFRHVTDVPASMVDMNAQGKYFWYACFIRGLPFICNVDGQRLLKYNIRANSWSSTDQIWPADGDELETSSNEYLPFGATLTPP